MKPPRFGSRKCRWRPAFGVCDAGDCARLERLRDVVRGAGAVLLNRREKLFAYTRPESLASYLILEQDRPAGLLYRRSADWAAEPLAGDDRFELPELEITRSVEQIYAGALKEFP